MAGVGFCFRIYALIQAPAPAGPARACEDGRPDRQRRRRSSCANSRCAPGRKDHVPASRHPRCPVVYGNETAQEACVTLRNPQGAIRTRAGGLMRKSSVMVASAVLASAALGVGPAYGASGNGAQQEPFYKSNSLCTGPIFDTSGPTFGFAMTKENTAQNTITTEVSLNLDAPRKCV